MHHRFKTKEQRIAEAKRLLWVCIGTFTSAFFMNVFIIPMGLYSGGFMGIAQIIRTTINQTFHINTGSFDYAGIINLCLNAILFFIARKSVTKMYLFRNAFCIIMQSIFLSIIPIPQKVIIDDMLASAIIGGLGCGLGGGIMFRNGANSGGMDMVCAVLIKKVQNVKIAVVSNSVNAVIFGIMFILYGPEIVIYSLIVSFIYPIVVDRVFSQNISVQVHIITKKGNTDMQREIFQKLNRGITTWDAVGAYTGEDKEILFVLVSKYEINHLLWIVKKHDPDAMIVENIGVRINGHFDKRIE